MKFDGNQSLRNLKFSFEKEILGQYKVPALVGGLTAFRGKYPLEIIIFEDGYLSKELICTSKTNG